MGILSQEWVRFRERVSDRAKAREKPIPDEEIFWAGMAYMYHLMIYDTTQGIGMLQAVEAEITAHYEALEARGGTGIRVIRITKRSTGGET